MIYVFIEPLRAYALMDRMTSHDQGYGVGRNFRWSRSGKEFLGGVGIGKNVPTPTSTSV
jgi:hypothetical protein